MTRLFYEGVPQGSMLAPLLFIFAIDSLNERLPPGIKISLFADGVALWALYSVLSKAAKTVERGAQEVFYWSKEKQLALNRSKYQAGFFIPCNKEFSKWCLDI